MLKVSRPLAIVFYVVVVELSGRPSVATICSTRDCKLTENDFADFMEPNVDPCQNFFKYACGKANGFLASKNKASQFDLLRDDLVILMAKIAMTRYDGAINKQDSAVIKFMKQQLQVCRTSVEKKVQDTVSFFNNLPIHGSWWKLETFLVKEGFDSSFFVPSKNKTDHSIVEFHPLKYGDINNVSSVDVEYVLKKLRISGLSSSIDTLLNGCSDNSWGRRAYPTHYTPSSPIPIDQWPDYWIQNQHTASSLSREDWNAYFNSFWSGKLNQVDWINRLKIIVDEPDIVSQLGKLWADDANELKSVITCSTLRQLMLTLRMPQTLRQCQVGTNDQLFQAIIDRQLFPEPLKKGVKKIVSAVELMMNALLYQRLSKVGKETLFIGDAKLKLYRQLVNDARLAIADYSEFIDETKCCGNCEMSIIKKEVERVMRFEKRYPLEIKELWTSKNRAAQISSVGALKAFNEGNTIGAETGINHPLQLLKVTDNRTSSVNAAIQEIRFNRELNINFDKSMDMAVAALTMVGRRHVKFRKDRPAALNYGGFGALMVTNYLKSGFSGKTDVNDLKQILDVAWKAYVYDKKAGLQDYGRLSTLQTLDDDMLFFLAFANTQCGSNSGEDVNDALRKFQPFVNTYCQRNTNPSSDNSGYPSRPLED